MSKQDSLVETQIPSRVSEFRRRKSFSSEFPDIPVLAFDSEGDVLNPNQPKIRIRSCTWNTAGSQPNVDLAELLGLQVEQSSSKDNQDPSPTDNSTNKGADIIALGFQELSANPVASMMEIVMSEIWTSTLKSYLSLSGYVLLKSIRLQGLLLLVFCKNEHLKNIRNTESSFLRLGASGWWGNKGAVGISLDICGTTFCFLNSHLSPHEYAFEDRVQNHRQILSDLVFSKQSDTVTILEHDYVFWMGDFNFRMEGITQDKALFFVKTQQWANLLKHDQLHRAAFVKGAFSSFQEGKITFPPTYKFETGTNFYDTRNPRKIRRPSYCDRILWRKRSDDSHKAALIEYKSYMNYQTSDHKPVGLVLEVQLGEKRNEFIVFDPIDRWYVGEHGYFRYSAAPGIFYSPWDWVGLYKVTYSSFDDYLTYVWTPGASSDNLGCISGRYITKPGFFKLIYFSSEQKCGIGFSDPFEIVNTIA